MIAGITRTISPQIDSFDQLYSLLSNLAQTQKLAAIIVEVNAEELEMLSKEVHSTLGKFEQEILDPEDMFPGAFDDLESEYNIKIWLKQI